MKFIKARGASHNGCYGKNLDCAVFTDNLIIIADGATPLNNGYVSLARDYQASSLFVDSFIQNAVKLHKPEDDLRELVQRITPNVREELFCRFPEYSKLTPETAWMGPSLAFGMVSSCKGTVLGLEGEYAEKDCIQVYTLGGCRVVIHGHVIDSLIADTAVEVFDRHLVEKAIKLKASKSSYKEALQSIHDAFVANRQKQNTPAGYSIFNCWSVGETALGWDWFCVEDVWGITMFTDGVAQCTEPFNLCESDRELGLCLHNGVDIVSKLRTAENDDRSMEKFPRIKPADDATWICADIST